MIRFGIDIGGTTVKIGAFIESKMIDTFQVDTNKEDNGKSIFSDVAKAITDYLEKKNISVEDVEGFGFGIPGNVINNYIYRCPNAGITNVSIEDEFGKFFRNKKIASDNDANVAALGEMVATNKYRNAVFITLGTGVGGGIIYDGKLISGVHGAGGEIGHMIVDNVHNFQCTCGLKGCLETVSSATGICRLYRTYAGPNNPITAKGLNITCKYVCNAAKQGEPNAVKAINEAMYNLAKAMASIAVCVDPEVFIIGGGVSYAGEYILDLLKKYYQEFSHYATKKIDIILAALKNDAGMLGAACLL